MVTWLKSSTKKRKSIQQLQSNLNLNACKVKATYEKYSYQAVEHKKPSYIDKYFELIIDISKNVFLH